MYKKYLIIILLFMLTIVPINVSALSSIKDNFYVLETTTTSSGYSFDGGFLCNEGDTINVEGEDIPTFSALIKKYWSWVVFLVPIALLVFITYDFFSALISNDADSIKKSSSKAIKRVIAALILLLTPLIVETVLGWFGLTFCFY